MRATAQALLWTWIVLDSGASSVLLPQITDGKFIDECVREHNKARSSVSPPASDMLYMTWDEGLATAARAWAKNCVFKHNVHLREVRGMHPVFPSVGENMWRGYPPSSFTVKTAVETWVNETTDYNYMENRCSTVCGHYTQVVWASTYKVGCAVQLCPSGTLYPGEGVLFLCNYAPAGNIGTRLPYNYLGSACSPCKGVCQEKLCRSPERDEQKSYDWTPDWEPSRSGRLNYATTLIIRPIALFFTFIMAYAVHYKYPSVFCYE